MTPGLVTQLQNRPKQELQITAQDYKLITACFLTSDKEADQNQASRHHDAKPDGACYISSSRKVE